MNIIALCLLILFMFSCRSVRSGSQLADQGMVGAVSSCAPELPPYFDNSPALPISQFICSDEKRYPEQGYPNEIADVSLAKLASYWESFYWKAIGESNFEKIKEFSREVAKTDLIDHDVYGPRFRNYIAFQIAFSILETGDQLEGIQSVSASREQLDQADQILKRQGLSLQDFIQANNFSIFLDLSQGDLFIKKKIKERLSYMASQGDCLEARLTHMASQGDCSGLPLKSIQSRVEKRRKIYLKGKKSAEAVTAKKYNLIAHEAIAYASMVKTWTSVDDIIAEGAEELFDHLTGGNFEGSGRAILNTGIAPYRVGGLWMAYADAHAMLGLLNMQTWQGQDRKNDHKIKSDMIRLYTAIRQKNQDYLENLEDSHIESKTDALKCAEPLATLCEVQDDGRVRCPRIFTKYPKSARHFAQFFCGLRQADKTIPKSRSRLSADVKGTIKDLQDGLDQLPDIYADYLDRIFSKGHLGTMRAEMPPTIAVRYEGKVVTSCSYCHFGAKGAAY